MDEFNQTPENRQPDPPDPETEQLYIRQSKRVGRREQAFYIRAYWCCSRRTLVWFIMQMQHYQKNNRDNA